MDHKFNYYPVRAIALLLLTLFMASCGQKLMPWYSYQKPIPDQGQTGKYLPGKKPKPDSLKLALAIQKMGKGQRTGLSPDSVNRLVSQFVHNPDSAVISLQKAQTASLMVSAGKKEILNNSKQQKTGADFKSILKKSSEQKQNSGFKNRVANWAAKKAVQRYLKAMPNEFGNYLNDGLNLNKNKPSINGKTPEKKDTFGPLDFAKMSVVRALIYVIITILIVALLFWLIFALLPTIVAYVFAILFLIFLLLLLLSIAT